MTETQRRPRSRNPFVATKRVHRHHATRAPAQRPTCDAITRSTDSPHTCEMRMVWTQCLV